MSLLLLFPSRGQIWTPVGVGTTVWSKTGGGLTRLWGDWASTSWGTIQTTGLTWDQMAGYMFANNTGSVGTVWTKTAAPP